MQQLPYQYSVNAIPQEILVILETQEGPRNREKVMLQLDRKLCNRSESTLWSIFRL